MTMPPSRHRSPRDDSTDLDLIAQRIVKLAEIATLDHLEMLLASQAKGMLQLAQELDREAARSA